jgi:uncharacterized RDD family membrane protein YckC
MVDLKLPKKRMFSQNAPILKRLFSFIIDFLLIEIFIAGPFSGIVQSKFSFTYNFQTNFNALNQSQALMQELIPLVYLVFGLVFLYFVIFEYILGQTPGKIIFKLKLVSEKKDEKISFLRIVLRNIIILPISFFVFFWIIDPIFLLIKKRRLLDIFSKTNYIEEISL